MRIGIFQDARASGSAAGRARAYGRAISRAFHAEGHEVVDWFSSEVAEDPNRRIAEISSAGLDFLHADLASWTRLHAALGAVAPIVDCPVVDADFASTFAGGIDADQVECVARSARLASLGDLEFDGSTGKTAAQRAELRLRLDERDFDAMIAFRRSYDHSAPDRDALARLRGLDLDNSRLLICAANWTALRGLQFLLAAMPEVFESIRDAQLVVVGNGSYREVLEALVHAIDTGDNRLWQYIREQGLALDTGGSSSAFDALPDLAPTFPGFYERVHFLGGLDGDELRAVLQLGDVYVATHADGRRSDPHVRTALAAGAIPAMLETGFEPSVQAEFEACLGSARASAARLPFDRASRDESAILEIGTKLTQLLAGPHGARLRADLRHVAVENYDWRVRAREWVQKFQDCAPRA